MEKVEVPAAPGRLINAVARIGYDHEVALCDLLDNCIDARASSVSLSVNATANEEEGTNDITEYVIADDGSGMDRAALINAFTLGTQRKYPSGSLGKFGLGLKSAGLALANQVAIVTRNGQGGPPMSAVLTLSDIEESGRYQIDLGEASGDLLEAWEKYARNPDKGSVLLLRQLNEGQPSVAPFVRYLRRYLGQIYHYFIAAGLEVQLNGDTVDAIDPLFMAEAESNGAMGDIASWDGKSVRLLLKASTLDLDEQASGKVNPASIEATHLVHPPSFDDEGQRAEKRSQYLLEVDEYTKRPRHGFYIYRNRRMIILSERFHGVIPSAEAARAFRARLMFDETADAILSLDVKKRHCQLPPRARAKLRTTVANHVVSSEEAWTAAGQRASRARGDSKEATANTSINQTPVTNLDYAPGTQLDTKEKVEERRERQKAVSAETRSSIHDKTLTPERILERAKQNDVVMFSDGLKANAMWLPYPAVEIGKATTIINRQHSWVAAAYAAAEAQPGVAIVLHQLFTILARAELEVRANNWGVPEETVRKVMEIFRKRVSAIGEDMAEQVVEALRVGGPEDSGGE